MTSSMSLPQVLIYYYPIQTVLFLYFALQCIMMTMNNRYLNFNQLGKGSMFHSISTLVWCKIRAEPIFGGAGSNSKHIEDTTGTETVRNHAANGPDDF